MASEALLRFTERGDPASPAVVLLHGLGTTGWMWDRPAAAVDDDLRLLVVDLPGHGNSRDRPWTSLQAAADDVADLVSAHVDGPAHLVGLSLGGYVAVSLAARRPDVVAGALVSGVNVLPFPHPRLMRLSGRLMSPFMTAGPMLRANARALAVPAEDVGAYVREARRTAPGTFLRVGAELSTFTVPGQAPTSSSRVLAVAGELEHGLIRRSLTVLADAFPNGQARVVPGGGHAWPGQYPELFAEVLRAQVDGAQPVARLLAATTG